MIGGPMIGGPVIGGPVTGGRPAGGLLLVGGAGPLPWSLDIARTALVQAHRRGLRTHLTNRPDTLAETEFAALPADSVSAVDFEDPAAGVAWALGRRAAGEDFRVVLGVREMAQVATAEIAEALGRPGNPPDAVRRVRSKDECRAALAAAGFAQPRVAVCAGLADAERFAAGVSGPWVVKPRDGMGSRGVTRADHLDDLPGAVAVLPAGVPFLIEEYVTGPEYSVEGVFLDQKPVVLAVTAKEKAPPPYFVEVGHILPAELPDAERDRFTAAVTGALTVLGLRYGVFHVELWNTPDGVVLGEVHVRNAGAAIHRMLEYAIDGLELFGVVYDDALGRPPRYPGPPVRAAATRFLTSSEPGVLRAIEGWAEVAAHPAVLHAELAARPGTVVGPLRDADGRLGAIMVGAPTAARARVLAHTLAGSVRFVVEPAGGAS
ncbi:ATP-grasp domain-containing protein [Actinoplanes sp. NPDC051411]|uniref:ATP-grasp domain-containing protein n=1 Tax=Actinoplanes sp. NPDC051411 TaxID=3155522 RepID=UPI003433DCC1